jgi:hypothetical protein
MGRVEDRIDPTTAAFLEAQPVFFVASAPLAADGRVNCSPKGNRGELKVLGSRLLAYADQTGSGAETAAHLRENGRLVLMACALWGPPRIVRVHGRGRVVERGTPAFLDLAHQLPAFAPRSPDATPPPIPTGVRALVVLEVERVSSSCGYGVPLLRFEGHRPQLDDWAERKGPEGLAAYRASKNARSIDGLPALGDP